MSETKEVQEVQILTEEQIKALPKEVKENVVFLTETMNPKDLIMLNPIVVELLNIEKEVKNITLVPLDDKGKFNVENVKSYKAIKASIGSFNTKVTASAKEMKAPQTAINKSLIAIEKSIKDVSSSLKETVMAKFELYEADVKNKAKIALDKKNQALIDAKNEATEKADKLQEKNKKSNLYNEIKYIRIGENITESTSKAAVDSNEASLVDRKQILNDHTFDIMTKDLDVTILDDTLLADLKKSFITSKTNAIKLLESKLADFATKRENIVLEAKSEQNPIDEIEVAAEVLSSGLGEIPPPPGTKRTIEAYNPEDFSSLTDDQLYSYFKGKIDVLNRLIEDRIKLNQLCSPAIYKAQSLIRSIIVNL